jgi:hypothetical protein
MRIGITPRRLIKRALKDKDAPTACAFGLLMAHCSGNRQFTELLRGLFLVYLRSKYQTQSTFREFIFRTEGKYKEEQRETHTPHDPVAKAQTLSAAKILQAGGFHHPQESCTLRHEEAA